MDGESQRHSNVSLFEIDLAEVAAELRELQPDEVDAEGSEGVGDNPSANQDRCNATSARWVPVVIPQVGGHPSGVGPPSR